MPTRGSDKNDGVCCLGGHSIIRKQQWEMTQETGGATQQGVTSSYQVWAAFTFTFITRVLLIYQDFLMNST